MLHSIIIPLFLLYCNFYDNFNCALFNSHISFFLILILVWFSLFLLFSFFLLFYSFLMQGKDDSSDSESKSKKSDENDEEKSATVNQPNENSTELLHKKVLDQSLLLAKCQNKLLQCSHLMIDSSIGNSSSKSAFLGTSDVFAASTPIPAKNRCLKNDREFLSKELVESKDEADMSSLNDQLTADLLRVSLQWKKSEKELRNRDQQLLDLEQTFIRHLNESHVNYVNLWQQYQAIQRDYRRLRSEVFRDMKMMQYDIYRMIVKSKTVIGEQVQNRLMRQLVQRICEIKPEQQHPVNEDGSANEEQQHIVVDSGTDKEEKKNTVVVTSGDINRLKSIEEQNDSLMELLKKSYSTLNSVLIVLMDMGIEAESDDQSEVTWTWVGWQGLLSSVSQAASEVKKHEKSLEERLLTTMQNVSEYKFANEQLESRLQNLQNENENLEKKTRELFDENNTLKSQVSEYDDERLELLAKCEKLVSAKEALTLECQTLQGEVKKNEKMIANSNSTLADRELQLQDAMEQCSRLTLENGELKASVDLLKEQAAQEHRESEALRSRMQTVHGELDTLKMEHQFSQQQLELAESQLNSLLENKLPQVDAANFVHNEVVDRLDAENENLRREKRSLTKRIVQLEIELKLAKNCQAELINAAEQREQASSLIEADKTILDEEVADLRNKVESFALNNEKLLNRLSEVTESRDKAEVELAIANDSVVEWQQKYQDCLKELKQRISVMATLRDENENLEIVNSDLQRLQAELKSKLNMISVEKSRGEVQKNQYQSNVLQLETQLREAQDNHQLISQQLLDCQQDNFNLERRISIADELVKQQDEALKLLINQKHQLENKNNKLEKMLSSQSKECKKLQETLDFVCDQCDLHFNQSDKLKEGVKLLVEEKGRLISEYLGKAASCSEMATNSNLLLVEKDQLTKKVAELNDEIRSLHSQNGHLEEALNIQKSKLGSVELKLNKCRGENLELSKTIANQETTIRSLDNRLADVHNDLALAEMEKQDIRTENRKLKHQLDLIDKSLEMTKACSRDVEKQRVDLEKQMVNKQGELANLSGMLKISQDTEQELKRQLETMSSKRQQLMDKLNDYEIEMLALRTKLKKEELNSKLLREELAENNDKIAQLMDAVDKITNDRVELDKKVTTFEKENLLHVQNVETMKCKLRKMDQQFAERLVELSRSHQDKVGMLENRHAKDLQQITALEKRIHQLEKELDRERSKREMSIMRSMESLFEMPNRMTTANSTNAIFRTSSPLNAAVPFEIADVEPDHAPTPSKK
ncbi:Rootletin [Trichinella spiralis]|uniref:Rootletin n=1 Tax=Trichinella spiralis TaxID=6334 RepID=A0ABR3KDH6_TRISP